jgi:cardiolipin synthase
VPAQLTGEILLWIAAVLTLVTGWDYVRRGLELMAPGRVVRPKRGAGAAQ